MPGNWQETEERGELRKMGFIARTAFGRCVRPYFGHFTPFHHFYSDLPIKKTNQTKPNPQKPPCVKHLEFGIVLAYEGSPSLRRTAQSTSRVRGMGKSEEMYADAMVSEEECPMVGPREPRKRAAEAHSHSVGS